MKKIILSALLFFMSIAAFTQKEEENGIIYISHPYIDVVNKSVKAYLDKDIAANTAIFADTATVWVAGLLKPMPVKDALKEWATDFDYYGDITVTKVGYPDYLHYKDKDQKYVQSWWQWSGKSKKTGEVVKIDFVQFDRFNSAGKIENEALYGDFSKMDKK
jgi:hypothetical protein